MADTEQEFVFVLCEYMENPKNFETFIFVFYVYFKFLFGTVYILDYRLGSLVVCKHLTIHLYSLSPSLTSLHGVNLSFSFSLC